MKMIRILFVCFVALMLGSCLTTSKKPVSQGPFTSEVSDTISRLSAKLPAVADKGDRQGVKIGEAKAIHVRRDFQDYRAKKVELRDVEAEKSEILDLCCKDPRIKASIDHGVAFYFDYYGKNGLKVASTVVDQNACQQHLFSEAYGKVIKKDGVYLLYASGIVKDTQNHLEWFAGPDKNVTWHEADRWVKNLRVGGGNWRLPTLKELETLYRKGAGPRNMTPLLNTTGWWVWSGETVGAQEARSFSFGHGFKGWIFRGNSSSERVFAVRSQ